MTKRNVFNNKKDIKIMKGKKVYDFKVFIEPDETGGYVVSCPSLAGCYSQGETIEESLENIKEAIMLCLEDMKSAGEKIL